MSGSELNKAIRTCAKIRVALKGRVPPCILHAILITWLNGWCTSRRFQQTVGKCRLCRDCDGLDQLEHYVRCPCAWRSAPKFAKLGAAPRTISDGLMLEEYDADTYVRRAVMLYALYGAFNSARASGTRLSQRALALKLKERFRTAAQSHQHVSQLFAWKVISPGGGR